MGIADRVTVEVVMRAARVLVVDDHELVRLGLRSILATSPQYSICGEASDGNTAVQQALELNPDLVILEINLRGLNGLAVAREILIQNPGTYILIFTELDSEQNMRDALEAGVCGFVLKSDPASCVLAAAEALLHGGMFFTSCMRLFLFDIINAQRRVPTLTRREYQIVQLVAEGHCSKDIARILDVSAKTVETLRTHLRQKLKVTSTSQLVIYAVRNGIVQLPQMTPVAVALASVPQHISPFTDKELWNAPNRLSAIAFKARAQ